MSSTSSEHDRAFISAQSFSGVKSGYFYGTGNKGVGYYEDLINNNKKRDRFENPSVDPPAIKRANISSSSASIDDLVDRADNVAPLDPVGLKQLLLTFEKKVVKNQQMRLKYYDEPEKFMESEIELNACIEDLGVVAASPELYPIIVEQNSVRNIVGLISHENTDVSLAVINLLEEMLDANSLIDVPEALSFVQQFLLEQGMALVVQNLGRLDDQKSDEDAEGVTNSLSIIENLVELVPEVADQVCSDAGILKFLIARIRAKVFDAIQLHASETLSILLQASQENTHRLVALNGMDGLDELLQAVAPYRKRNPESLDEAEYVNNLFLCLNAVLVTPAHQEAFCDRQGLELMLRCLKEQKYASIPTVRTINFALTGSYVNCIKWVELGGLKFICPIFMGKGLPKPKEASYIQKSDVKEAVEVNIATLSQLCMQLHNTVVHDCGARLLVKLTESDYEKLNRTCDLFDDRLRRLSRTEDKIMQTVAAMQAQGADVQDELAEYVDESNLRSLRLAGGLEQLQYLSAIILYIIAHDTRAAEVASSKLQSLDLTLDHVKDILDDWIESIASDDEILADGSTGTEPTQAQVLHARALKIKVLLETWLPSWPGV